MEAERKITKGKCRDCKYFKPDTENPDFGECFYWKKSVSSENTCEKFKPLKPDERPIIGEEITE